MIKHKKLDIYTEQYNQFILITEEVDRAVEESGIKNGMVFVVSGHTTTGIMVNEGLECLEDDIKGLLGRLAPEDGDYYHARFLHSYSAMAGNPTGHLKSMLAGFNCMFPVIDGKCGRRSAQDIYLCEFDGPQRRQITITVMGE